MSALALTSALVRRDLLRLRRDTGRWLGLVIQPLLLWAMMGSGFTGFFHIESHPDLDYHRYFFPGLSLMVSLFTAIFATMAVIEDRDQGFLQQVLVAPAPRFAMVLGKLLGVLAIALVQLALLLPAAVMAGFELAHIDYLTLVIGYTLATFGMTGFSFALAWLSPTTHAYHAIMGVLLIPLWMISGAMFPLPDTGWLSVIATFNPMSYALDVVRYGFENGAPQVAHASFETSLMVLVGFVFATFALATWVARPRTQRLSKES